MTSAEIVLEVHAPAISDIDFTTEVIIALVHKDSGRVFTGYVVEAIADRDALRVTCSASPALQEPMTGQMVSKAPALDLIYALLRQAGIPDQRLRLQGLEQLPVEIFEVAVPIAGLALSERIVV